MFSFFITKLGRVFLRCDEYVIHDCGKVGSKTAVQAIEDYPDLVATGETHLLHELPLRTSSTHS